MINRIPITIDERGSVNKDITILAMENENLSKTFSISLPNSVIDKWIYIEFEKADSTKFVSSKLTAVNGYVEYDLGINLLDAAGKLICQVVAKDDSGVVWKSNKFDFTISGSINATEQVVESSPDVIADLQRQIDNISTGGDSGGDTSGEYVPVNARDENNNVNTTITNDGSIVLLKAMDDSQYSQIEVYPSSINIDAPALTYRGQEVAIKDEIPIDGISIFMVADGATFTLDGEEIIITSEFLTPNDKEPKADDLVIFPNTGIASATDGKLYKIAKYRRSSATAYLATTGLTLIGGGNVDLTNYYTKNEVDTELSNLATIDELTTKQDTLTAGSNITIIDNVINAIGDGGTTDYNALENKPSINGVELSGNKTLADLGITDGGTNNDAGGAFYVNFVINESKGWENAASLETWGFDEEPPINSIAISLDERSYGHVGRVKEITGNSLTGISCNIESLGFALAPIEIKNLTGDHINMWNETYFRMGVFTTEVEIAFGERDLAYSDTLENWGLTPSGITPKIGDLVISTNEMCYGEVNKVTNITTNSNGVAEYELTSLDWTVGDYQCFGKNEIWTQTYNGTGLAQVSPYQYTVINCEGNTLNLVFMGTGGSEVYRPYQFEIGIDRVVPVLTIRNEEIELPMGFALEKYKRYQCEVINNKLSIKGIYNNYPYKWVFGLWTSADYTTSYNFKEDLTCTQTISGATTDGTFEVNESDTAITISVTLSDETFLLFTKNEDGTITSNGVVYTKLS